MKVDTERLKEEKTYNDTEEKVNQELTATETEDVNEALSRIQKTLINTSTPPTQEKTIDDRRNT